MKGSEIVKAGWRRAQIGAQAPGAQEGRGIDVLSKLGGPAQVRAGSPRRYWQLAGAGDAFRFIACGAPS